MTIKEGIQLLKCEKCNKLHLFPSKPGVKLAFPDPDKTTFNWTCRGCGFTQSSNPADLISIDDAEPVDLDRLPKLNL